VIRAVICDFGGVLTSPLHEGFVAYQEESGISLEALGTAMGKATEKHGDHPLFELERGAISEEEFGRRLAPHLDPAFDLVRLRDTYVGSLRPNRPMIEFVAELRGRGLRTALCTNNVREWEPLWRPKLPEIDELFEVVVDSAFVGMRKPEPEIYQLTIERLGGVAAEECVFVDDLDLNCEAARRFGMAAVRFASNEQAIADIEEEIKKRREPCA
jgi:putative hydrolase of the HAD superfamily